MGMKWATANLQNAHGVSYHQGRQQKLGADITAHYRLIWRYRYEWTTSWIVTVIGLFVADGEELWNAGHLKPADNISEAGV
jgi:hypothetical protein